MAFGPRRGRPRGVAGVALDQAVLSREGAGTGPSVLGQPSRQQRLAGALANCAAFRSRAGGVVMRCNDFRSEFGSARLRSLHAHSLFE
jgi:hypothetical protein